MPETLSPFVKLEEEGLADHHCHCDYSIDASGTIVEYCQAALSRGLQTLCFTTHYDANPKSYTRSGYIRVGGRDIPAAPENLAWYVEDVLKAKEQFAPMGLRVKLGVEVGWYDGCEEGTIRLFERYPFDYKLCGVHEIDHICFCSRASFHHCFATRSAEYVVADYFRQSAGAARSGLFTTIAHLGYYLRTGMKYYGEEMLRLHRGYIGEFFEAMRETGTALEINTGGIRHGHPFFYPTPEILSLAREARVPVSYLGSDSHSPEIVGFRFEDAAPLRRSVAFQEQNA